MTISFDLDNTLIPGTKTFETERQIIVHRFLGLEKIRLGTIVLFKALRYKGHQIFVYTTSFRSGAMIKLMFCCYGIPVDAVINQQRHNKQTKGTQIQDIKIPPAFGIDIHVDDSRGLRIEGERYNLRQLLLMNMIKTGYRQS